MTQQDFQVKQDEHFAEAAHKRFTWHVSHPVISKLERNLLGHLGVTGSGSISVLEVGCGEGANIANLAAAHELKITGVDYSQQKNNLLELARAPCGRPRLRHPDPPL